MGYTHFIKKICFIYIYKIEFDAIYHGISQPYIITYLNDISLHILSAMGC